MRWEFSAEQQMFQESLHKWLQARMPTTAVRQAADSGDPSEFEHALADDGWFGVGHPEASGGQGGGLIELALAAEEFGLSAAPSAAWHATALALPALPAPEAAELLKCGAAVTFAAPSDGVVSAAPPLSVAGGRVSGTVPHVLGGDRAARAVVRLPDADGAPVLGLVDVGGEGVVVLRRRLVDSTRSVADLEFRDAPVRVIDTDAAELLRAADLRAAVLTAADALGAAARMLAMAVEYAKQRKQFGVPIGSFQAVKHAAATMLVTVEAARSIVYYAAASVAEKHPECALHAAAAKAQVTGPAAELADSALTLHGAIGYTWEYDLQLFYKRAKLDAVLFGSVETWNERLASELPLLGVD